MYKRKKILGLIIARAGSKGLKNKNLLNLAGKPLVDWTFIAAKKSKLLDHVMISTDDLNIIKRAAEQGVHAPFRRPINISDDKSSAVDVALHALNFLKEKYDYLVLLQATSPLRQSTDIDEGIRQCINKNAKSLMGIVSFEKNPFWLKFLNKKGEIRPLLKSKISHNRRQDADHYFLPNGAIYVVDIKTFRKKKTFSLPGTLGLEMPIERSIDIDSKKDLVLAEYYMKIFKKNN